MLFVLLLALHVSLIRSSCDINPLCYSNANGTVIVCDGSLASQEDDLARFVSCFPSGHTYILRNFQRLLSHTFDDVTFPSNQSLTIQLINVALIDAETFSKRMQIPASSSLSIDIDQSSLALRANAFSRISIDRLRFHNVQNFNGRSLFDTDTFGSDVDVRELIFEHCSITGFSSSLRKSANVQSLLIVNASALTELNARNLPPFLPKIQSLEVSNTALRRIDTHSFQAWSLVLEDLKISQNPDLDVLPLEMVDGVLMKLKRLDLSYNPIRTLRENYSWFAYSYVNELVLRGQQIDLFLKTNILKSLSLLTTIDLSEGFVGEMAKMDFPPMVNLVSIDVSHTNLTEDMIIDLLTSLSKTTQRFIDVRLLGHQLNESRFCSYLTVFQNAPNLLNLQLDPTHECNCIVDLFYTEKRFISRPTCLDDSNRTPCHIQMQASLSQCNLGGITPDKPNPDGNIGRYAFSAVMAGLGVFLLVLLSLGFGVVYQIRRNRRGTDLDMEHPIVNPLAAIVEESSQTT